MPNKTKEGNVATVNVKLPETSLPRPRFYLFFGYIPTSLRLQRLVLSTPLEEPRA